MSSTDNEPLEAQVDRLARYIMENIPGEPSRSEGAIDTAIRLLAHPRVIPGAIGTRVGELERFDAFALGPDDVLVVNGDHLPLRPDEDLAAWRDILEALIPGRWLVINAPAGLVHPSTLTEQPTPPVEARPAEVWATFAPELRTRLKQLAGRFNHAGVAEAAAALSAIIDEHGPRAEAVIAELDNRRA